GDSTAESAAGSERHGIREIRVERVDGLNPQAGNAVLQPPAARVAMGAHRGRELQRLCISGRARRAAVAAAVERLLHSLAHFCGGLAREGDREYLLGLLD